MKTVTRYENSEGWVYMLKEDGQYHYTFNIMPNGNWYPIIYSKDLAKEHLNPID